MKKQFHTPNSVTCSVPSTQPGDTGTAAPSAWCLLQPRAEQSLGNPGAVHSEPYTDLLFTSLCLLQRAVPKGKYFRHPGGSGVWGLKARRAAGPQPCAHCLPLHKGCIFFPISNAPLTAIRGGGGQAECMGSGRANMVKYVGSFPRENSCVILLTRTGGFAVPICICGTAGIPHISPHISLKCIPRNGLTALSTCAMEKGWEPCRPHYVGQGWHNPGLHWLMNHSLSALAPVCLHGGILALSMQTELSFPFIMSTDAAHGSADVNEKPVLSARG